MENNGKIYELIGKAIGMIGAIGKDNKNAQQGFKYRSIDQVYNALNPVLAELGIFFCPEVLEQKREERTTKNGTALTYTLLTMKYTAYAPDGSSVSMTVVGEGMDSGDKGSNKAMSIAYKYALFQLFCIPTEEMKDPDADVYTDVLPKGPQRPQKPAENGTVTTSRTIPQASAQEAKTAAETPGAYIKRRIGEIKGRNADFDFMRARAALIQGGVVEDVPSATMSMEQAVALMDAIEANFGKAS